MNLKPPEIPKPQRPASNDARKSGCTLVVMTERTMAVWLSIAQHSGERNVRWNVK